MGNCLVTKLKSEVQNDSLRFLNSVEVYVFNNVETSAKANSFRVVYSKNTRIKIVGNGSFTDSSLATPATPVKYLDIPANVNTDVYFTTGNYKIILTDADSLKSINTFTSGASGTAAYKNYYSDLNQFVQCTNIDIVGLPTTETTGDLMSIKDAPINDYFVLSNTKVTGDINKFIEYQITNKGRTGNLENAYINDKIKVNGGYTGARQQITIVINSSTNYICYIGTVSSYTSYVEYNYINGEWVGGEPVTP